MMLYNLDAPDAVYVLNSTDQEVFNEASAVAQRTATASMVNSNLRGERFIKKVLPLAKATNSRNSSTPSNIARTKATFKVLIGRQENHEESTGRLLLITQIQKACLGVNLDKSKGNNNSFAVENPSCDNSNNPSSSRSRSCSCSTEYSTASALKPNESEKESFSIVYTGLSSLEPLEASSSTTKISEKRLTSSRSSANCNDDNGEDTSSESNENVMSSTKALKKRKTSRRNKN
ncbi:hypothetical protein INT46_010596 [Mucor plumbeus]|uniref:Uncharacterized protein n=1 Tax=Mucor plumbeus TaxID=97098 RepID=A0A8H7QCB7_9FUNG|nr:hypothetical protein INT46_010596 [Mucor plumbeus]